MKQHLCNTVVIMQHKTRNVHPPFLFCSRFVRPHPTILYIFICLTLYIHHHLFLYPHFFFLNFFCTVVNIQQMMPRVQTILKPRTSPFVKAYGGIASFFLEKFFMKPCKSCTSPKTCQKMGKCKKRSSKRKLGSYKMPGY